MTEILEPEGEPLLDVAGERVGRIDTVYVDPQTDAPQWAVVSTGIFGARRAVVPLEEARQVIGGVQVPYQRAAIRDAPRGADEDELSVELEHRLRSHYTVARASVPALEAPVAQHLDPAPAPPPQAPQPSPATPSIAAPGTAWTAAVPVVGRQPVPDAPPPGPIAAEPAPAEATLHAEQLLVGTATRASELIRVSKRIVTEEVTRTVRLRHEVLRVEREPLDPTGGAVESAPADLAEEEWELCLMREEPVVSKRLVPVERVRIGRASVTTTASIGETLEREHVDTAALGAAHVEHTPVDLSQG